MDKKPIIALMYDFDKTLITNNMQNFGFIPSLGISEEEFWSKVGEFTVENEMDGLLSYMYFMLKYAGLKDIKITREEFVKLGSGIEFFPGVVDGWFERVNEYAKSHGALVEHYVISSGLQEIIEGSPVYKYFTKTFACEYAYDVNGVAIWPKTVVNFTTKTQYLFRINKGQLSVRDDEALNSYMAKEDRRIPFENMIYIGDGFTDVPCMKLCKMNGGHSIAVYDKSMDTAKKLMKEERIDFMVKADYSENSELEATVKAIIDKIIIVDKLIKMHKGGNVKKLQTTKNKMYQ